MLRRLLAPLFSVGVAACAAAPAERAESEAAPDDVAARGSELEQNDALRACASSLDCDPNVCACVQGACVPNGAGPPPPLGACDRPPPPPAPPDAYEGDDAFGSASHYVGAPQVGHTFHRYGDEDWALVYFAQALSATFETYNSVYGDTVLEVYSYDVAGGKLGPSVGSNDDVCQIWFHPPCKASRVTVNVPADSVYFIKVRDKSPASVYHPYLPRPRYDFRIY